MGKYLTIPFNSEMDQDANARLAHAAAQRGSMTPGDEEDVSAMRRRLSSMAPPQQLESEALPSANGDLPEYAHAKAEAHARFNSDVDNGGRAVNRRFAAMGALNSGAAIKQHALAEQSATQQRESTISGINAQQAQAYRGMDEAARGRNFQREQINNDNEFKNRMFAFDADTKLSALNLQYRQFHADREDAATNIGFNNKALDKSGGLLGAGGMLGTGIGAPF